MKHYLISIRTKYDTENIYHSYALAETEESAIKTANDAIEKQKDVVSARITLREATVIKTIDKNPGEDKP